MAHTPGPWAVQSLEPSTIGHDWVDGPDRRRVAVCSDVVGNGPHGYCQNVDTDEIAANARLIAAAPDLLEALSVLVRRYVELAGSGDCGNWDPELEPQVIAARAAITRATGDA